MIVVTIVYSPALQGSAMYFFLAFLSILDVCASSVVTPKMIADLVYERKTISFECCMTQVFAMHFFAAVEVIILAAMAYDRYVAICKPLHYSFIMNRRLCGILIVVDFFYERKTISFERCMTQLFTVQFFTGVEVIFLAALAYDYYVTISKTLLTSLPS
ncbi:hypothetical protein A6R68_05625 [Neotoma lepida]|uniref:G-protein coupled receptors family 1 profile domain-containing protein n=1 Tax=Neotoma lepida TaxID=56216 RepID=A0A1A6GJC2_NEOLE|nr:hypothetical protein A6R68_05625 [Neotoma lepida]